jgi:hypothetical protein
VHAPISNMWSTEAGSSNCAGVEKNPPRAAGNFFSAPVVQRNSRIRMISGIGIPTSQSRMGM